VEAALLDGLASLDVEMEREIMVKGWGQARSMPDRAVIDVLVETEAASREQAYGQAAGLTQQVDQVLANRASAVALARTAVLMVHPKSRWKRGESVRTGWRAVRGTSVEVTDFSQLGELIAEVTAAGGAVSGPTWRLDESNPAHREARRTAAEDARLRAEDYAGALGLTLTHVAWVSEPGLRGSGAEASRYGVGPAGPVSRGAGGPAPEELIDVTPAEMTTAASVEVGFRLRTPDA